MVAVSRLRVSILQYHDTKTSSGVRHDKQESSSSSTGSYGIRRCGAAPTPTEHPGERQNIRRPSRIHDRRRDDDKGISRC